MLSSRLTRFLAASLLALSTFPPSVAAAQPPQIAARSYILVDGDSHRVMLEKNADEKLQPASLTKLMTAYIVLDALKSGSIKWYQLVRVEATDVAHVADDEASMRLRVGQVISVKDLLTGLVVVSANDAAMVLSRTIAGSEGAFLARMNDYAHRLGLRASHFATPSGITTQNHYTTARDIAELSLRLTEDFPIYLAFSAEREFSYGSFIKRNKNRLLIDPTVDGLKTGHTAKAGYCLVVTAKRPVGGNRTRRVFAVVLGAATNDGRFVAGKTLVDYGFQ